MSGHFLNREQISQQFQYELSGNSKAPHFNIAVCSVIIDSDIYEGKGIRCKLKPQQVISVITEKISLKNNQIGFLYPKQKLYALGLWIVEPGYVHPGYDSYLRVHVVNLSRYERVLSIGDDILELLVFENSESFDDFPKKNKKNDNYQQYLKDKLNESSGLYPSTFLDIAENNKKISEMMFPKWLKCVSYIVSVAMLIFALISICSYYNINTLVNDAINIEKIDVVKELELMKAKINNLEKKQK